MLENSWTERKKNLLFLVNATMGRFSKCTCRKKGLWGYTECDAPVCRPPRNVQYALHDEHVPRELSPQKCSCQLSPDKECAARGSHKCKCRGNKFDPGCRADDDHPTTFRFHLMRNCLCCTENYAECKSEEHNCNCDERTGPCRFSRHPCYCNKSDLCPALKHDCVCRDDYGKVTPCLAVLHVKNSNRIAGAWDDGLEREDAGMSARVPCVCRRRGPELCRSVDGHLCMCDRDDGHTKCMRHITFHTLSTIRELVKRFQQDHPSPETIQRMTHESQQDHPLPGTIRGEYVLRQIPCFSGITDYIRHGKYLR